MTGSGSKGRQEKSCEKEFVKFFEKFLIHDGKINGYNFVPWRSREKRGVHGVIESKHPDFNTPAAFYFKWSLNPLKKTELEIIIKNSFGCFSKSEITYHSYILVTPHEQDDEQKKLLEKVSGSVNLNIQIYHYGNTQIQEWLTEYPPLQEYYRDVFSDKNETTRNFVNINRKYKEAIKKEFKHLQFVGLPSGVYPKQKAQPKPDLMSVYIPLDFCKKEDNDDKKRVMLDGMLKDSKRVVVLGNPGSGKTTLAKYLALTYCRRPEKSKNGNEKTPFIIPIREFERKQYEVSKPFDFIDFLKLKAKTNKNLKTLDIDRNFFISLLVLGKAIVVFDGLDEMVSERGRIQVAKSIDQFSSAYPNAVIWVTSRIAGYTGDVVLDERQFKQYYLAPVTRQQAKRFIKKWYEAQASQDLRQNCTQSLQLAVEENLGVLQLKSNPLLLTMMTLVHQFEGNLPENRAKLYEKCVELLLKTWQEKKYNSMGVKNPLEERGLTYDTQKRLLAAVAYHIQQNAMEQKTNDEARLIEEQELKDVLFNARYDKERMSTDDAKEDIEVFVDYIRDRTGLLVEKGEGLFSFVHISFLEYFSAFQTAGDISKSQSEHIRELLKCLGAPICWEPILLALHLFSRSPGPSFIDAFTDAAFQKLEDEENLNGWLLMGRAVRDNIDFAPEDINKIIRKILNTWLENREYDLAFSVLKEIAYFSGEGKKTLKQVIKESIINNTASRAFKSLYLYNKFFKMTASIPKTISRSNDYKGLLPYLPVYGGAILEKYVAQNLDEKQWFIYFSSVTDKTSANLHRLKHQDYNPMELKGYLLSSMRHIVEAFRERGKFLDQNKNGDSILITNQSHKIHYQFSDYAGVSLPFTILQPFTNNVINVTRPPLLDHQQFIQEDRHRFFHPGDNTPGEWMDWIVENTFDKLARYPMPMPALQQQDRETLMIMMRDFVVKLFHKTVGDDSQNLIGDFLRDYLKEGLSGEFQRHFIRSFTHYLIRKSFTRDILRALNHHLIQKIATPSFLEFCKKLTKRIEPDFMRDFISTFIRSRIHHLSQSFKKQLSSLYRSTHKKKLEWERLSESDYRWFCQLYLDRFTHGDSRFIYTFFHQLYEHLLYDDFNVSFEPGDNKNGDKIASYLNGTNISMKLLSMENPVMIPFIFPFLLVAASNHYLLHLLADLNTRFCDIEQLTPEMIEDGIDDYCGKNPFAFYLINFSWDFYAKDFNKVFLQGQEESDTVPSRTASFVANAAKISLTTGMPCAGKHWEKCLERAKEIGRNDLLVDISLTLYNLANFHEAEKNTARLKKQLEKLKQDNPSYYDLLGICF